MAAEVLWKLDSKVVSDIFLSAIVATESCSSIRQRHSVVIVLYIHVSYGR